jgi:hypothetical protein
MSLANQAGAEVERSRGRRHALAATTAPVRLPAHAPRLLSLLPLHGLSRSARRAPPCLALEALCQHGRPAGSCIPCCQGSSGTWRTLLSWSTASKPSVSCGQISACCGAAPADRGARAGPARTCARRLATLVARFLLSFLLPPRVRAAQLGGPSPPHSRTTEVVRSQMNRT